MIVSIMTKIITILTMLTYNIFVSGQELKLQNRESEIGFTVTNFGFDVDGEIKRVSGSIFLSPLELTKSAIYVSLDVKSVTTRNSAIDKHLMQESFFHAERNVDVRFKVLARQE
jgi:polyisoprenoid-binding protein YceI